MGQRSKFHFLRKNNKMNILIVDDEKAVRDSLAEFLAKIGHEIIIATNGTNALDLFHENTVDIIITDIRMPDMDGLELLRKVKIVERSTVDVIMITGHGDVNNAVKALQYGAYDYFQKPIKIKELAIILDRCADYRNFRRKHYELKRNYEERIASETNNWRAEIERLRDAYMKEKGIDNILVHSEGMRSVINLVEKFSLDRTIPILIQGESGTGKELIARYIHYYGEGKEITPFIPLNCAAIPDNLFESELFGYEAGAYTGAVSTGKKGKIEAAQSGSIFLDEIADMPLNLQVKLLRVIEDRKFFKLGATKETPTDVRFIFSTNRDLSEEVNSNRFRLDLYYRINLGTILIPSLRERRDGIIPLAIRFLSDALIRRGKKYQGFSKKAQDLLVNYEWPGNVRQLKNVMERLSFSEIIGEVTHSDVAFFLKELSSPNKEPQQTQGAYLLGCKFDEMPAEGINLEALIDEIIRNALMKNGGNKTKTAQYLGISRRSLHYRLKRDKVNKHA